MNVTELAHEAGYGDIEAWLNDESMPFLERFAALVAAHEREACARVCENLPKEPSRLTHIPTLKACAAFIRARGEK